MEQHQPQQAAAALPELPHPRPELTGRVALIAGGSRGIGADAARAFARAGASVVIGARDETALQRVVDGIVGDGGRAIGVRTDVTQVADSDNLVRAAMDTFGRLDFAFNNATADDRLGALADVEVDAFDRQIATNVRGTFLGMKFQIPAMLAGGGGAIVNMASGAGLSAIANLGAYATAKAGIIRLSQVAALDYGDQGVRVNVVAPGPILTEHLERAGSRAQELAAAAVPMRRIGRPSEVSDVVLWLCSAASSFVNGAVIPIDGGQSAGSKPPRMYEAGKPME